MTEHSAHDLYNALVSELNGMVKSFERRYAHNWNWRPEVTILDINFFDIMFFFGDDNLIISQEQADEIEAELNEIHARHRAMMLRDGNEITRAFDDMHNEYLDELAELPGLSL